MQASSDLKAVMRIARLLYLSSCPRRILCDQEPDGWQTFNNKRTGTPDHGHLSNILEVNSTSFHRSRHTLYYETNVQYSGPYRSKEFILGLS